MLHLNALRCSVSPKKGTKNAWLMFKQKCGKQKRFLVLNPAVGVSFLIMINLITRHSWKAGTLLVFFFAPAGFLAPEGQKPEEAP